MADAVRAWLGSLKLPQYAEAFLLNGYDDPSALAMLEESDLDVIGVTLPGHRKRLLMNCATSKAACSAPRQRASEEVLI